MSVSTLAGSANLPYSTVSAVVNEKKSLGKGSADTVYALSKSLDLSMKELLLSEKQEAFPDKYYMDEPISLFLTKRYWDECVYCGMPESSCFPI